MIIYHIQIIGEAVNPNNNLFPLLYPILNRFFHSYLNIPLFHSQPLGNLISKLLI